MPERESQKILIFFKKGLDSTENCGIIETRRGEISQEGNLLSVQQKPKGCGRLPPFVCAGFHRLVHTEHFRKGNGEVKRFHAEALPKSTLVPGFAAEQQAGSF